jgi:hypothetical protein
LEIEMPKLIQQGNPNPKQRFKEYLRESAAQNRTFREWVQLFEHEVYKPIPGTQNSYRSDPSNTNTMTLRHSHVYAKPKGRGKELYAVNFDGSGHDGFSGTAIPARHADFFRSLGYSIPDTNILESLDLDVLEEEAFSLTVLEG